MTNFNYIDLRPVAVTDSLVSLDGDIKEALNNVGYIQQNSYETIEDEMLDPFDHNVSSEATAKAETDFAELYLMNIEDKYNSAINHPEFSEWLKNIGLYSEQNTDVRDLHPVIVNALQSGKSAKNFYDGILEMILHQA